MCSCCLASRSTSTRRRRACCPKYFDGRIRLSSSGSFVAASTHATPSPSPHGVSAPPTPWRREGFRLPENPRDSLLPRCRSRKATHLLKPLTARRETEPTGRGLLGKRIAWGVGQSQMSTPGSIQVSANGHCDDYLEIRRLAWLPDEQGLCRWSRAQLHLHRGRQAQNP